MVRYYSVSQHFFYWETDFLPRDILPHGLIYLVTFRLHVNKVRVGIRAGVSVRVRVVVSVRGRVRIAVRMKR